MKTTTTLLQFSVITDIIKKAARSAISLPPILSQILIGQLLSDANATRTSVNANVRLTWSFGKKYEEYARYVASLFRSYCNTGIYFVNTGIRLKTLTAKVFNQYYDMFYVFCEVTGKMVKVVPVNILDLMTPVVLAHLIMGDGNYDAGRNRVPIYTNSYSLVDCQRLADSITRMGIVTKVMRDKKGPYGQQYILTIGAKQLPLLREMVGPHMHNSMLYRLGM